MAAETAVPSSAAEVEVSVLIVSYRTREMTLACLRSVFAQTRDLPIEVFLVDNASDDGTAEAVAAEFPQVRLLAETRNHGFAGANNLAASRARGRYLLLLNPDTVVLDGAIQKLWRFAQLHPEAGIIGGRTLYPDGSLNPASCWGLPTPWSLFCRATGLSAIFRNSRLFDPESLGTWPRNTVRSVDMVTGCLLLLRADLWHALGGFDPAFFMYAEDADLCLRARARGYPCLICPDATIIHYRAASEPVREDKLVRLFTAKVQLFRKHYSRSAFFNITMLKLWTLTRLTAHGLAALFLRRSPDAYRCWRNVLRRRHEWTRPSLA